MTKNMLGTRATFISTLVLGLILLAWKTECFAWQKLNSPSMRVLETDEAQQMYRQNPYPWFARWLQGDALKHDFLTSGPAARINSECDLQSSSQRFPSKKLSFSELTEIIENKLSQCQDQWISSDSLASNLWQTMMIRNDPLRHPFAKFVEFKLGEGLRLIRLKGLLGLKPGPDPRPLVILRLGIFSNSTEFLPERFLFQQLFEESPFHILLLESTSGSEFIARNSRISLGAYEEALQNFWVAKLIMSSKEPISQLVESVHLAGMSLGGNGVLMTALLNQVQPSSKTPTISSITAFCPVVQLRQTLDFHFDQGIVSKAIEFWARQRLKNAGKVVQDLSPQHFLRDVVHKLESPDSQAKWFDQSFLVPEVLLNEPDYWKRNEFWNLLQQIQTPLYIYATQKDPVVPFFINSNRLIGQDPLIDVLNSKLKVFELKAGYHCSLAGAYDPWTMSELYQSSIINWSKGNRKTKILTTYELSQLQESELHAEGIRPEIEWAIDWETRQAMAQIKINKATIFSWSLPLSQTDFGDPQSSFDISDLRVRKIEE